MSKPNSESDINVDDTQDQENSHTSESLQIHNIYNTTMHDKDNSICHEYDTSEDENISEIETFEHYGEKIHETEESKPTETSQILTVFNKAIHHEDDSVEKLQFSLFLISCCQGILNSTWLSWYLVLKIACLHVSFTAFENFYKLSKMYCLLVWFSTFQPSEVSENRDPTIKHISTYTLISSFISTYMIDLFLVIHFT